MTKNLFKAIRTKEKDLKILFLAQKIVFFPLLPLLLKEIMFDSQFPLWFATAGNYNCGSCISDLGLNNCFDDYNKHDSLWTNLIEGIDHFSTLTDKNEASFLSLVIFIIKCKINFVNAILLLVNPDWQFPLHAYRYTSLMFFLDVLLVRISIYYNLMASN